MNLADAARRYAQLGWALTPTRGKAPYVQGWQETEPASPDDAAQEFDEAQLRGDGMGLVLGSSNVVVLERDGASREEMLELLGVKTIEELRTAVCITGSGREHIYFSDPGDVQKRVVGGMELRSQGHIVVLPPSVHPDTAQRYKWLPHHAPWEVGLMPLLPAVREFFAKPANEMPGQLKGEGKVTEGSRHQFLLQRAGLYRRAGDNPDTILEKLRLDNAMNCDPPKTEAEIEKIARDTEQWEKGSLMSPNDTYAPVVSKVREFVPTAEHVQFLHSVDVMRQIKHQPDDRLCAETTFGLEFRGSRLTTLSGYEGDGKTSLALQMAADSAYFGARVVFATVEMSNKQAVKRFVNIIADGDFETAERRAADWDISFIDALPHDLPGAIEGFGKVDLLVVDHLHHMSYGDRFGIIEKVQMLKELAKEQDIAVLLLAQLNRQDGRVSGKDMWPKPSRRNLAETAAIAQLSDSCWWVWRRRDNTGKRTNAAEIYSDKERFGNEWEKHVIFVPEFQRFQDQPLVEQLAREMDEWREWQAQGAQLEGYEEG
jgi:hypothetical protein